jgi:replicative DNA helicase
MFEINKTLLQILKYKKEYNKIRGFVKLSLLDKEIVDVIKTIDKYWKEADKEETEININVLNTKLFTSNNIDEVKKNIYQDILLVMQDDPDEDVANSLIKGLREIEFAKKIDDTVTDYSIGLDICLYDEIQGLVKEFEKDLLRNVDCSWCDASIEDIIQEEQKGFNLNWPLKCLQQSMPTLKTGQQVIIAARPGKGKTSFCAHACTQFAQQLQSLDRPILWFNNESKAIRIKGTCFRSALNKTFEEIIETGWNESSVKYNKIIGKNTIRIYDIHGRDYKYIERIISDNNPIVVVWDMLDNIRGFESSKREDQRLENLYQWARESSVIYDFLSLPTSQISDSGSDMMFVPDAFLKDSRTGKQGACDAIITIGSIDKQGFENSRFINIPKYKNSAMPGCNPACKTEVVFDGDRARYLNPKVKQEK